MIPSDRIRALSHPTNAQRPLLDPFNSSHLGSYYYNLHVKTVVFPGKDARIIDLERSEAPICIQPGKLAWLRMKECVSLPSNMVATLEQTHHHTREGLSFLNLSLIFPNYSGYITCVVANFGSSPIHLVRFDHIARLVFFENSATNYVNQAPKDQSDERKYDESLVTEALKAGESFLGIESIRSEIVNEIKSELQGVVSRATWKVSATAAVILALFTIMPVLQTMFTNVWYGERIITRSELSNVLDLIEKLRKDVAADEKDGK